jgi:acetoin utilization deacetylase AcuC-like enzyme
MARTGLVRSPIFHRHPTGPGHPERPARLEAIERRLEESGLLARLTPVEPRPAEERWLEAVHDPAYLRRVERACGSGERLLDSPDTGIGSESYAVALLAVGGALALVDAVLEGRLDNGFAAVRPPGHHAERDRAMGFCLFNNVAVAARYAQRRHGAGRVLIVDWDVHHGNGTQHAFEDDPSVFYGSLHQWPLYPGTGAACERGRGSGEGFTLNLPLPPGSRDADWLAAFDRALIPAADSFRPDLVLVSAGFDAHRDDPLAGTLLSEAGFTGLTQRVCELARRHCGGRLVSLLEGGYHLRALADCVAAHVGGLLGAGV